MANSTKPICSNSSPDDIEKVNGTAVSNSKELEDDTVKEQASNEKERGFKEGLQDNSDNEPIQPQRQ